MTTQLLERFSATSGGDSSRVHPSSPYHGPTDDVLTCDGICQSPRPLSLAELERVIAAHAASPSTPLMRIWLSMARAVAGKPGEQREHPDVPTSSETNNAPLPKSFEWSTPEGATRAMTGRDHPHLSLPEAACAPFFSGQSPEKFHPLWVEEAIGFITARAAGCAFEDCVAITRSTPPESRLNHFSALTGLRPVRISNLSTAATCGFFYLAFHKPEEMTGQARAMAACYQGLAYADEQSVFDHGGEWSHLPNMAGPLLGAERLLSGPHPHLFERGLLAWHCCAMRPQPPSTLSSPSVQTLFLSRFYDATLLMILDSFKTLDSDSILPARATTWGTLLSNDVYDYVSDGLSGRVANLCWAMGTWDSPIVCARLFRGCLIAAAQAAHHTPGPLFALIEMEFVYLYTGRYCYYTVPCDRSLPFDDTYIPFSLEELPSPDAAPVHGFRAALRTAFSGPAQEEGNGPSVSINTTDKTADSSLPPWRGLAATPCDWDNPHGEFDGLAMRATYDILGCLDRGVYASSPGLYRAHLAWMIRQYDIVAACGRDTLGVGRYYVTHRVK
ncbi:hypothetical protein BO78DRAFT_448444 [Aspergillus sclerotiicarbonarius CBS 121057]|uniref:Uncharacterized protein n=1 Tax=Aspergillus sclerotiicarbonarius (strain CBS 121057 / IBT 28362) TaxID=1448318 RepID=A0A319ESR9_ASPSB|nr:hypothetical protein BO78DRAFT_448444 [Aspergillus sclerotiicarbonarius CBS 121057]